MDEGKDETPQGRQDGRPGVPPQGSQEQGPQAERRRAPIPIQWHHSRFDLTVVSVQAMVATVTMSIALIGAFFIYDEYQDRRQARMTRAWSLLNDTSEVLFFNVGQIEALQSLHLSGANLRYMKMESRFLEGIDLRGADVFGSHFSAANLSGADLRDANLRRTRLDVSDLVSARMDDAVLVEAVVSRARMMEASLRNADLSGAILAGVDLTGADLHRAKLVGTDLTGADLTGVSGLKAAQLAEACADAGRPPTLPEGFSPPPVCKE